MKFILTFLFLSTFIVSNAQYTYVPDDNFEQALIDLGYDDVLDDYVLTASITSVTSLDVHTKNINDLTGIEAFVNLEELICDNNNIAILDLSSNTSLQYIECQYNQLISLNIDNCLNLEYLNFSVNNITTIDISNCTNLNILKCSSNNLSSLFVNNNLLITELRCSSNNLSSVDITLNEQLVTFVCGDNIIDSIDVSNNLNLNNLSVRYNQINTLDLSSNTNLYALECQNNLLTVLDVSNNPLYVLDCSSNELIELDIRNGANDNMLNMDATDNSDLVCVFVDDINFTNPDNWNIDTTATYVETQAECDTLIGVPDIQEQIFNIYPNPANDIITITKNDVINSISIFNVEGKLVKKFKNQNKCNISDLKTGIYYIKIVAKSNIEHLKLIKK